MRAKTRYRMWLECYANEGLTEGDVQELAAYNSRVCRGVVHTPEYVERMRDVQERFKRAREESCRREGITVIVMGDSNG